MSKIALAPNASGTGTFSIASPNSNTDRTLSLPDADGTVQVSGNPISGTTGTFSGAVSGTTGTFSGAVSGTTGTFSGNVTLGTSVLATPTGAAPSYTCRAWVNFNGTGTVAIRASGNVTSITDNGTGLYTVNFTTAMPDLNYATVGQAWYSGVSGALFAIEAPPVSATTKQLSISNPGATGSIDANHITVAIFR